MWGQHSLLLRALLALCLHLNGPFSNIQIFQFGSFCKNSENWTLLFCFLKHFRLNPDIPTTVLFFRSLKDCCTFFHFRSSVAGWGPGEEHFYCEHRTDWTARYCVCCHQYHPWTSYTWKWCNPPGLSLSAHTYSQNTNPTRKKWKWGEIRGEQVKLTSLILHCYYYY